MYIIKDVFNNKYLYNEHPELLIWCSKDYSAKQFGTYQIANQIRRMLLKKFPQQFLNNQLQIKEVK